MPGFFSECGHLIKALAPKTQGCADADGSSIQSATKGVIANCATAKQVGLCTRDPTTAVGLCPVTCGLGCGASKATTFGALAETCSRMPVEEMIDAIAHAECATSFKM